VASHETYQQLLSSFVQAVEQGELQTLTRLLADEVTLWADAGGKRPQAALRPIRGRDAAARFSVGSLRFVPDYHKALAEVNGKPAVLIRAGGEVFSVLTIDVEAGRIRTIYVMANPEKLARIA
jgi:RNA polymerase sigma-70 factor (ECF subfamily)